MAMWYFIVNETFNRSNRPVQIFRQNKGFIYNQCLLLMGKKWESKATQENQYALISENNLMYFFNYTLEFIKHFLYFVYGKSWGFLCLRAELQNVGILGSRTPLYASYTLMISLFHNLTLLHVH